MHCKFSFGVNFFVGNTDLYNGHKIVVAFVSFWLPALENWHISNDVSSLSSYYLVD